MKQKYEIYVRWEDTDGRWINIPAEELPNKEFKQFILDKLCEAGIIFGIKKETE